MDLRISLKWKEKHVTNFQGFADQTSASDPENTIIWMDHITFHLGLGISRCMSARIFRCPEVHDPAQTRSQRTALQWTVNLKYRWHIKGQRQSSVQIFPVLSHCTRRVPRAVPVFLLHLLDTDADGRSGALVVEDLIVTVLHRLQTAHFFHFCQMVAHEITLPLVPDMWCSFVPWSS